MAFSERKLGSLAPPPAGPAADRAPDELAAGVAQPLRGELEALLGADRLLGRAGDLVSYASDASPYRLFPRAVVMARDAEDVGKVLAYGREKGIPVTFRAGGTSLNGQGQSEGILVDVRRHFAGVAVEEDGALVRVKPGTILGHVNRVLAPWGRKLGPDPASTDVATVGGVIANNSGGMRCGITRDSYSTVRELTFVLPSGTTIDTAAPGAAEEFAAAEPELVAGLGAIRDEIRADGELSERIRRKFAIKNTTGYRLCAFLDAQEPLEIFRRLLVGSEGTLAFLAEAVFETVPLPALTTTAWVHFPSIDAAIAPVRDLVDNGATAVELMVAPALITAAWNMVGAPAEWKELPPDSAVLLVEFGAGAEAELDDHVAAANELLASHETIRPIEFTREAEEIELSWRVREGLHGLIGKLRLPGTALIVEDVCVPPERIAEGARDLQALLGEHGFLPGVAGHASAGNLHFMLTPDFAKREDLNRYEAFMSGLVELIVDKYDGSLKAEHGTGINMAPYVEREWGEKATGLMWRSKELADPDGVLSPGIVLNRDPGVHLRNLKTTPPIEESATSCVECGFCEPVCPSRNLTTTPRQRIVLRREMARQPAGSPVWKALLEEFPYEAVETCATDGSCQLACPVGIDTGRLVKELRQKGHSEHAERRALASARRWASVEGHRASACASAGRWRGGRSGGGRCRRRFPASCRGPCTRGPPRSTSPPAPTASSVPLSLGRRPLTRTGYRPIEPGSSRRWSRCRRGRGCRSGYPRTSPAAAAGCPGARRGSARRTAARRTRWSSVSGPGAARRAADRDRRRLLHQRRGRARRGRARGGQRRAAGDAGGPRLRELGPRPPPALARGPREGRLGDRPPDLRQPPPGPGAAAAGARRRARRGGLRRPLRDLLRFRRRPRNLPPRADRGGHPPPGHRAGRPRVRRSPLQQPHLRDRPRARHRGALRVDRDPARAANSALTPRRRRPSSHRGPAAAPPSSRPFPCGDRAAG
ncbi:MAG: FAD-binding and (Fe-S)-binding domain-containing protein [Solirubrobacterales bacterium]